MNTQNHLRPRKTSYGTVYAEIGPSKSRGNVRMSLAITFFVFYIYAGLAMSANIAPVANDPHIINDSFFSISSFDAEFLLP